MCKRDGKKPSAGPEGFTLLELILVMVILTIVLSMAAPSLRGFFSSRKAHDAASNILSLVRFARTQAIAEGCTYRLNFDSDKSIYWLTSNAKGAFGSLNNEFGREFLLPDDTTFTIEKEKDKTGTEKYVDFFPQGMTESSTITLTDRRGDVIKVMSPSPSEAYRIVESEESST
jgi:type II secretion system protein H